MRPCGVNVNVTGWSRPVATARLVIPVPLDPMAGRSTRAVAGCAAAGPGIGPPVAARTGRPIISRQRAAGRSGRLRTSHLYRRPVGSAVGPSRDRIRRPGERPPAVRRRRAPAAVLPGTTMPEGGVRERRRAADARKGQAVDREIRAPRGSERSCRGWPQEAALRMLMNNLDPDVAERPQDLVVYGGTGKAARNWDAYDAIVRTLRGLGDDETLLVQSGKPVGVFRTQPSAPRVLISNAMLVPKWADWETFWELERAGLTMYGQMTAGSWIYIGTQGILQGTYETLAECASQHFGSSLKGRIVLTAGLGGMGGAQPLAVTMNEGVALCVEVDPARIERRVKTRYLDRETVDLDEALRWVEQARAGGEAVSIGLVGNAAEVLPELVSGGFRPDVVTDQTSAHDPLGGYVPAGPSLEEAVRLRSSDPEAYVARAHESMARHVDAMVRFQEAGAVVFDYGNNLRAGAEQGGLAHDRAYAYPGV